MRDAGKTIVLVTHDMTAVEKFCHRAMLIHDGKVIDDRRAPTKSATAYLKAQLRRS